MGNEQSLPQANTDDALTRIARHIDKAKCEEDTEVLECIVCRNDLSKDDFPENLPTSACNGHPNTVCKACLEKHVDAGVKEKGSIEINCPVPSCGKPLDYSDIQRFASQTVFDRYDMLLLRKGLQKLEGFQWCKNPQCGNGQLHEGGDDYPIVRCSACGSKSCFRHDTPWHPNETCEEFDIKLDANVEDAATVIYKLRVTKNCPSCSNPIEKNGGCDHMTCKKPVGCGYEFCWLCTASYTKILQEGNHLHRETCQYYSLRQ